jgi:methionyl-tRNA formyltransferase
MKIVFMGTPPAAVPTLQKTLEDGHRVVAVWTQPDRPSGRGNKLKAPAVKEFALKNGLQVFQPTKIRTKKSIALFRSHAADVAVVVAYGRILSKSYLNAFPMGCINVHFSLLPKYRGAAPVNWAIVRGEEETGITTMQMDPGLDTGDILLQSKTEIDENENSVELMERLACEGADLLSRTLLRYKEITPVPQDHDLATMAPLMSREDGLIDWSKTALEIRNQIRGFQPFPGSYTSFKEEKLTLWKASLADETNTGSPPGRILTAAGDELSIKCGKDSVLRVSELQIAGKRRMETRDFLNGVQMQAGDDLG